MISVSAEAAIKVVPDLIVVRLGVQTSEMESPDALYQTHSAKVTAVIEALKKEGIHTRDIKTDHFGMAPYSKEYKTGNKRYYAAQKSIACTIREPAILEKVLKAAFTSGATHLQGIVFKTTELRKHRDTVRLNAMKAAKEKADLLTGALGVKTGKPISISENYWNDSGYWTWGFSFWDSYGRREYQSQNSSQARNSGGGTEEAAEGLGQITISSRVNVSFAIE